MSSVGPGSYGSHAYGVNPYGGGTYVSSAAGEDSTGSGEVVGFGALTALGVAVLVAAEAGRGSYGVSAYGTTPYGGGTGSPAVTLPLAVEAVGFGLAGATGTADRLGYSELTGFGLPGAAGKASEPPQVIGLGQISAFGMSRRSAVEMGALGSPSGVGRRTDFSVSGLGAITAAGKKTGVECVGLSETLGIGQVSTPPTMAGLGASEGFGQRTRPPQMEGLATSEASGSRASESGVGLFGMGAIEVPAMVHPEMSGLIAADVSGQRLFRRRRLTPGWIKIRARQEDEWTTDPPPLDEQFGLTLQTDSAWYGPFDWGTYTENFYPGDGYGQQLLELTDTTALFVYRYDSSWFPPEESPYYTGGERFEAPIAARRLTLDPATGIVTSGPEVLLASHPLVEGAGGNPEGDAWISYPEFWSFDLVSTSPTETRLLFRFYDGQHYYDFFPGRPYLFNGTPQSDWGYDSAGLMMIDIDWANETVTQGPFNRLGGPIGLKEEYWGQDIAFISEEYNENPTEFEFWSWEENEGDVLVMTQMLTPTRGVTAYTNSWEDYQLIVTTFDLDSAGVVTELDTYAFPARAVSGEGMIYYNTAGRLLKFTANRIAILATSDPVVTGTNSAACWSFSIDSAGLITFEGKGINPLALYGDFMGGEVLSANDILFFESHQGNDWVPSLARVHVPNVGVPTFSSVMTAAQMAHPDQDETYFDECELGSDGAGRWVAVWHSSENVTNDDHLYARAGRLVGEALELTDPVQISPANTDHYYNWEHWSCWLGDNRFLHGRLADRFLPPDQDDYSIRTAVLEVAGG